MQQEAIYNRKWLLGAGLAMLLAAVAAMVYTSQYAVLLAPAVYFYLVLIGADWKAAYWILLFVIPFSFEVEIFSRSLSLSVPDEPMVWLFTLLCAVFFAYNPLSIPGWWWKNPLVIIIAIQFIWLVVAVVNSQVPWLSVKFLLAKCWMLACFFVFPLWIFKEKKDYRIALSTLFIATVVTILIITYRHAMVDFQFRLIDHSIGKLYYNHVEYSTVLSMLLPVLVVSFRHTRGMNKWWRFAFLLIVIAFVPVIFFTYARAAILAILFAGIIGIAIKCRLVNFVMPAFYGFIALLMVYMVKDNKYIDFRPNYEQTYMHSGFTDHIIATFKGQDMSSMERLHRWIAAIRMSSDKPIVGYGPHGFYDHYKPYTVLSFRTYVSRNPERSTTHNYFLYMLVEQGWPAMILYAVLVVAVFAKAQRIYHRFSDRFYKSCTLGIAMMFAACFVNNFFSDLIETHKVGALFYLGIALLVILDQKSKEQAVPAK